MCQTELALHHSAAEEGGRVYTQCYSVVPVYPPAIGIVDPKIMNSSKKTWMVHDQAVSADRSSTLPCSCVGAGRASRDRLPAERHGRMASAKRGIPANAVTMYF